MFGAFPWWLIEDVHRLYLGNFISTIAKMGITNNNTEMVAEMVDATISLR